MSPLNVSPAQRPAWAPQIRLYTDWLTRTRGLRFADYESLWRWSVTDLDAFWQSVWDYFEIASPTPHTAVLAENRMPGAIWFPGAQINYGRQLFRHTDAADRAGLPALIAGNEEGQTVTLTWPELLRRVRALAAQLRACGVQPGDRVAAYLPNTPEAAIALLATVSLGAVWSICAPDMGVNAIVDRFRQIDPKVLVACNGVRYGGRELDKCSVIASLRAQLPSIETLIVHQRIPQFLYLILNSS